MVEWVELAREAARAYGVPENVFVATIEAETGGRNVTGDDGDAYGYGQVWPKWWADQLAESARRLGQPVPADAADVLRNDRLSMYWAAGVARTLWDRAGGDFTRFVRGYVGEAVSDAEIERRRGILARWSGQGPDVDPVMAAWEGGSLSRVAGGFQVSPDAGAVAGATLAVVGGLALMMWGLKSITGEGSR